ncbi:MAG: hypothetical protein ACYDBB_04010 [Armatimonadota bacterium]
MSTKYLIYRKVNTPLVEKAVDIFTRVLYERTGLTVDEVPGWNTELVLDIQPGIGVEGYRIDGQPGGPITITGDSDLGLLYGVGRLLHDARYDAQQFTPGLWRGVSVPDCPVRGMYFALHQNWYVTAPKEDVHRYIEDLALWGINTIAFHLPEYGDPNTSEAAAHRAENHALLQAAKRAGMKVGLLSEPNIVNNGTPPAAILAPEFRDTDPVSRGFAGTRVCPSLPEGFAYLSRMLADYLDGYEDIGIDYVLAYPYDAGGCGCAQCWPWGARGFVTISKEFSRLARERYPDMKFIAATWCFDVCDTPDGEYEGLDQALHEDAGWVDYLMTDAHGDFPRWPLEHGSPGYLPMVNFAEISMWGRFPWGGYGANPLPERYQRLWNQSKHLMSGGFPYSEGNFEDINKVIYSQFFWHKETPAWEAVRAYIAYEFSPEVVEVVAEAIAMLERNYPRAEWTLENAERAWTLLQHADTQLPERVRQSWRWRILYLRALIDYELLTHDGAVSDRCDQAYEELIRIFHLEDGWGAVTPRSRSIIAKTSVHEMQAALPGASS